MTALHSVCQCLQSSASGKTAENKLQKALNRVHKLEQASSKTGHPAVTLSAAAAASDAQPAIIVATDPSSQQALEPSSATDAALTPGESLQTADVEMDDVGTSQAAEISQPPAGSTPHPAAIASGLTSEGLPIGETAHQADKENVRADKEKCKAGKDAARAAKEKEKAEKEALKEQQTADKEQLRQQKEQQKADKERQKAEKEQQKAEREQQKAEKDTEKERIRSASVA